MKLQIKKYIKAKNKKEIKASYFNSFPKEERMPFGLMVLMSLLYNTNFYAFYDNGLYCGFIYMASIGKQCFIMFFAVPEKQRAKGYGTTILNEIQQLYPQKKIIVSIEPCEGESIIIKERRRNFYLKNGYKATGFMMNLAGQKQEILIKNGEFSRRSFIIFFMFYSNFTIIPKIWEYNNKVQSHCE